MQTSLQRVIVRDLAESQSAGERDSGAMNTREALHGNMSGGFLI